MLHNKATRYQFLSDIVQRYSITMRAYMIAIALAVAFIAIGKSFLNSIVVSQVSQLFRFVVLNFCEFITPSLLASACLRIFGHHLSDWFS